MEEFGASACKPQAKQHSVGALPLWQNLCVEWPKMLAAQCHHLVAVCTHMFNQPAAYAQYLETSFLIHRLVRQTGLLETLIRLWPGLDNPTGRIQEHLASYSEYLVRHSWTLKPEGDTIMMRRYATTLHSRNVIIS